MTTCDKLGRWLDAGRPEAEAADHRTHAAGCARCAAALATMDGLEAALRISPSAHAPAWLAAAVMRDVNASPHPRHDPAPTFASRKALVRWSLGGLGIGAAAWGAVEALSSSTAAGLVAQVLGPGLLQAPDGMAALAVLSTLAAGFLTWASLRLARAIEHAAL
jgi:hypothetical protein